MSPFRSAQARAAMLVGLLGFWLGLAIACWRFPGEYDWRYMTVSNLFSAKHNPTGYLYGAAGVVICGVLGTFAVVIGFRQPQMSGWRRSLRESWLLVLGFPCMVLAASLPSDWLPSKGHDWLAVISFVTLCSGLVWAWVQSILKRSRAPALHHRLRAIWLCSAVLWPVAGAALTQAYLALLRPELPWVTLAWRQQRVPLILSFALWEWLTCVVLSACLATLCTARKAPADLAPK